MRKALLLIDIQNIYFMDGPYLLEHPEETAEIARLLLNDFRNANLPVIHVQHEFNTLAYSEDKEFLNAIHKKVAPIGDEKIIHKTRPSSFYKTELDEYLANNEIDELVVCGMMSHMCIDTTVRACQDRDIKVTVIEDACTTKSLTIQNKVIPAKVVHQSFMAGLNKMFAKVETYDMYKKNM